MIGLSTGGDLVDDSNRGLRITTERWQVGGQPKKVIAIGHPTDPNATNVREVGVESELIEREIRTAR